MLINWFTVGAQILNFMILVWLLKRFLYRPILNAIDLRDKQIAKQVEDAAGQAQLARKQMEALGADRAKFDAELKEKRAAADRDIDAAREKSLALVEEDSQRARSSNAAVMKDAQVQLGDRLSKLIASEVFEIARNALGTLANTSLESEMAASFVKQLRELDQDERNILVDALSSGHKILVRSVFKLNDEDVRTLQGGIDQLVGKSVVIDFESSSSAICGIDLSCNGQQAEWTIASYLSKANSRVSQLLNSNTTEVQESVASASSEASTPGSVPMSSPAVTHQDTVAVS